MSNRLEIEEDEIDIRELFNIIKRNIWTIVFITWIVVIITNLYLYSSKPIYSSSVTIALDNQKNNKLTNILPEDIFVDSKAEEKLKLAKVTLQSKKFINTIIDKVNIDKELFIKKNFRKQEVSDFSNIKIDIKLKNIELYEKFFEIVPLDKNSFMLKIDNNNFEYKQICKYNENINNKLFSLRVIKTNGKSPFADSFENKIINFF